MCALETESHTCAINQSCDIMLANARLNLKFNDFILFGVQDRTSFAFEFLYVRVYRLC